MAPPPLSNKRKPTDAVSAQEQQNKAKIYSTMSH